jgi:RES domain-containing protein
MLVYRLTNSFYKDDLSGQGAYLYGGRWNEKETYALYAAEHISLSLVELLVHTKQLLQQPSYHLLTFLLPDESTLFKQIAHDKLSKNWKEDISITQYVGTSFLKQNQLLYLKVPSIIVPNENNVLINPKHPLFKKIKLKASEKFDVDRRLL